MQLVLAVVPPRQHLEHRLPLGDPGLEPLGEEADDLLGDGGQASIRSARFGASSSESSTSSPATPSRTLDRSWSTSGWSNQRNRMLRARSPTIGNRSWVAPTSRSSELSLVVGRGVRAAAARSSAAARS